MTTSIVTTEGAPTDVRATAYKRFRTQQVADSGPRTYVEVDADTGIATVRPDLVLDRAEPYVCVACPDAMITQPEQHELVHHDGAQTCWLASEAAAHQLTDRLNNRRDG